MSQINLLGEKRIDDLQWRFSISVANSSNSKYSQCFIQMLITILDKQDNKETLHLQLNLEQFNELYKDIDKIHNILQLMR